MPIRSPKAAAAYTSDQADLMVRQLWRVDTAEPAVWRRIQTPTAYSFWDLHVAIQDSMGWLDYHLHAFSMKKPRGRKVTEIGLPDEYSEGTLEGWQTAVADYFTTPGATAFYEYDFGDRWEHEILLEGVLLAASKVRFDDPDERFQIAFKPS